MHASNEWRVARRDPLTKYDDAKGYMFNIAMLKRVFSPKFYLHDIRQTGEHEATTRWTMVRSECTTAYLLTAFLRSF